MRFMFFLLAANLIKCCILSATTVTGFSAFFKHGQVFCTWNNLPFNGVEYRLYKSPTPIIHGDQLVSCEYLGFVRDSSSFNHRLSEVQGMPLFLKIDSLSDPLTAITGLFVTASQQQGNYYYALTIYANGVEDTAIYSGINSLILPLTEWVEYPEPVFQLSITVGPKTIAVYVLFTGAASTPLFPRMINVGSFPFNFSVVKSNTATTHPLTIRLTGGGGNFLSGVLSGGGSNEYRIGLDDWLPNDERSLWFGYHEGYDVYSLVNSPPVSGINYDYALERLQYTIDWAIRKLPVDSNSIYFIGTSGGAAGAFFSSLTYPSRIAAVSMTVPKFDLSFLNDPDTTNNYNAGKPGRLRVDTLIGTVATNLMTNLGVKTYDLVNGGWLANQHADDNIPLLFAVNGKRDTMVGWAEKIAYYDSVNANRLGGYYFWDNRKHNGEGQQWIFSPDLMRYHRNLSYPAFSNCSFNNEPGDGHASNGDSLGTINGFLDWKDDIEDDSLHYTINLFMRDLSTISSAVFAPDSCLADITLRRLQQFSVPAGAVVLWKTEHLGEVIDQDSFFYTGGLITLSQVKILKDTVALKVSYTIPTQSSYEKGISGFTVSAFPNPSEGNFTIRVLNANPSPFTLQITDLSGRIVEAYFFGSSERQVDFSPETKFPDGIYFVRVFTKTGQATIKLIVGGHY